MLKRSQIKMPTPAEDAAITAAALQDPDAQPLTDADVLDAFRASGLRWQTRMNEALRDWLKSHSPV